MNRHNRPVISDLFKINLADFLELTYQDEMIRNLNYLEMVGIITSTESRLALENMVKGVLAYSPAKARRN
jgi:hypothetical protein